MTLYDSDEQLYCRTSTGEYIAYETKTVSPQPKGWFAKMKDNLEKHRFEIAIALGLNSIAFAVHCVARAIKDHS